MDGRQHNLIPKISVCVPKIYVDFLKNIDGVTHMTDSDLVRGLISEIQPAKPTR